MEVSAINQNVQFLFYLLHLSSASLTETQSKFQKLNKKSIISHGVPVNNAVYNLSSIY